MTGYKHLPEYALEYEKELNEIELYDIKDTHIACLHMDLEIALKKIHDAIETMKTESMYEPGIFALVGESWNKVMDILTDEQEDCECHPDSSVLCPACTAQARKTYPLEEQY